MPLDSISNFRAQLTKLALLLVTSIPGIGAAFACLTDTFPEERRLYRAESKQKASGVTREA